MKSKQGKVSMSHCKEYKGIPAEFHLKVSKEKSATLQQLDVLHIENEGGDCLPINSEHEANLLKKYKKIKVLLKKLENLESSCFVYKSVFMYQMSVHVSALYQMSVHVYLCISTVPNEYTCVSLYQHCTK